MRKLVDLAMPATLPRPAEPPPTLRQAGEDRDRENPADDGGMPAVSVIISTLDRAAYVETTLEALRLLRYPRFEVVVVEGPSTDATAAILDRWETRIKRVACPARNLSVSRNLGLAAAAGTLVAFIDDDSIPEPDWLDRLVAPFTDPGVAVTGGAIRNFTGVRYQCRALTIDLGADVRASTIEALAGGAVCPALTGTNFCVRRELALAAGLFDEAYVYFLEESDLQRVLFDANYRLVYDDHAEVHHQRAANVHRDGGRVPSDYVEKMSSTAYFCLKHRRVEDTRDVVALRIARHLAAVVDEVTRLERRRRLTRLEGLRRILSAGRGLRKGLRLSERRSPGWTRSVDAATDSPAFLAFPTLTASAPRLALIRRGSHQSACADVTRSLAKALAAMGCEVTLVEAGPADRASFHDGYWTHSVVRWTFGVRHGRLLTIEDGIRELRRVDINRQFDAVVDLDCGRAAIGVQPHPWRPQHATSTFAADPRRAAGSPRATQVRPDHLAGEAAALAAACAALHK